MTGAMKLRTALVCACCVFLATCEVAGDTWNSYGFAVKRNQLGLIVDQVRERSPAAREGLRVGDRITRINYAPVLDDLELASQVTEAEKAGAKLRLTLDRRGLRIEVELTQDQHEHGRWGFHAEPLPSGGLRVVRVEDPSFPLRVGDEIYSTVEQDPSPLDSLEDLQRVVEVSKPPIRLRVRTTPAQGGSPRLATISWTPVEIASYSPIFGIYVEEEPTGLRVVRTQSADSQLRPGDLILTVNRWVTAEHVSDLDSEFEVSEAEALDVDVRSTQGSVRTISLRPLVSATPTPDTLRNIEVLGVRGEFISGAGFVVESLSRESRAARMGVEAGDRILKISGIDIEDVRPLDWQGLTVGIFTLEVLLPGRIKPVLLQSNR